MILFENQLGGGKILQCLTIADPTDVAIQTAKEWGHPRVQSAFFDEISGTGVRVGSSVRKNSQGFMTETLAIAGGGEALLAFATLGPNENEEVTPEPILLRIVYRNEKHFSLPKSRRKDDITDTGWLPPCRPIKAVPFRDVWLIGKKELRWLWGYGKG